jgi:hypothetical protein
MARTHCHGNPKWTCDETILASNLYFDCHDPGVEAKGWQFDL